MKSREKFLQCPYIYILIILLFTPAWSNAMVGETDHVSIDPQSEVTSAIRKKFLGLKTNLFKRSIDLTLVFDGGPGKDGIPAISDPQFVAIESAKTKPSEWGVLVSLKGKHRFYPYNILVWHEIVNDTMAGKEWERCRLGHKGVIFLLSGHCLLLAGGIVISITFTSPKLERGLSKDSLFPTIKI